MLLNIKVQEKTKSIVFTAPDGTIYSWRTSDYETEEKTQELFCELGRTVLEVINDPEQPVAKEEPGQHRVREGQGGAGAPGAGVEDILGSARARYPLLDGIMRFAEDMSVDEGGS